MSPSTLDPSGPGSPGTRDASPLGLLLERLAELRASDLHLKPGRPPLIRLNGELAPIGSDPLEPEQVVEMLDAIIPDRLQARLADQMAIEFGYGVGQLSRFRVSIYHQRGTRAAVLRRVAYDFPSLEDWGLPEVLGEFCKLTQGLVLITGPTGTGKSSTLAAMMQRVADTRPHHIITIEDPIEFLISDRVASVSQREVGTDTPSFSMALHNALRLDPDAVMVGEMRDEETIGTVLMAAETGHAVFSTLHTNSAVQTVDRIVGTFPKANHEYIRQRLASVLEAVASLQLVPRADGAGMVAAVEILRRTPRVSQLILKGEFESLQEEIESSVVYYKMQSMNQSLASLLIHGAITRETAMSASWNPDALDLLLRQAVGMVGGEREQGGAMADSTADYSKILELQEIKKLYDDSKDRHAREIRARDEEILTLRERVALGESREGEGAEEVETLRAENRRLKDLLQRAHREVESRPRTDAAADAEESKPARSGRGRGFFRR